MASPNLYPPPPAAPPPPQPPVYRPQRSIAGTADPDRDWADLLFAEFRFPLSLLALVRTLVAGAADFVGRDRSDRACHRRQPGISHPSPRRRRHRAAGAAGGAGSQRHYSSDVDWSGVRDQIQMDDDLGGIFGTAYTFEDTLQQSFPAKANLRVVCDRGTLNISPSDDNTLRVVVHKKLYAQSQNDGNKYNEQTKPQITVTGNSVLINANTNGAGEHGVESDMDIFVPPDAALDIASKRGDVTVTERKADVKIALQNGDVELSDIAGAAKVSLEKGSLRASKIAGDLDVDGRIDNVTIDEVAGAVHLNGDFYDDIRLSKIAKTVTFKTSRSDMEIASVPGDIEIASDEVRGSDLTGPSRVVTSSKDIHLEDISGDLQVESNNGNVEVTTAGKAGQMNVSTQHGD